MVSPLSLDVGYFFGEFQCLPADDCSAVSCDSGALTRLITVFCLFVCFYGCVGSLFLCKGFL